MISDYLPWRSKPLGRPRPIQVRWIKAGEIAGIVNGMTDGEVTYLSDLWVHADCRGKGIGTALMEKFMDKAKDTTVVLLTRDAPEFYRKFGFEERTAMVWRKK